MAKPLRILFTKAEASPEKTLLFRILIVLSLIFLIIAVLWLDRDGLKDQSDNHISLPDIIYFAMVTITTVGYGDIVPVTERARLIDALLITPIRFFIFFIFLGTAYQFVFQKLVEDYRMAKLQRTLSNHIIICGYGHTGRIAAKELIDQGSSREEILVVDLTSANIQEAAEAGLIAIRGDGTEETTLRRAGVDNARAIIVSPGRDDTNALIVLTARNLNRSIRIISSLKHEENRKILKQAGADMIVSPSTVGGYLLADAVERSHTVDYLYDLMTAEGRVHLFERTVAEEEIGNTRLQTPDGLIIRVHRGQTIIGFWELEQHPLQKGDTLVLISPSKGEKDKKES